MTTADPPGWSASRPAWQHDPAPPGAAVVVEHRRVTDTRNDWRVSFAPNADHAFTALRYDLLNALLDAPAPPPGVEVDLDTAARQVLDHARSVFTQCQDNPEHPGVSFFPPLDALGLDISRKTEIWVVTTVAQWENRGRIQVISHTKAHWRRSTAGTPHQVLDHLTIRWPNEARRATARAAMHYFDTNRRNNT
jgi:hypothetical protein